MGQVKKSRVLMAGALIFMLVAAPAGARPSHGDTGTATRGEAARRAPVDRDWAADIVQRSTGGRVLAVETALRGSRTVYLVKVLLPGGHVRTVTVDGQTGQTH